MIVDMHCDMLSHENFSPANPAVRSSPDQLIEGGVNVQVCALFTESQEFTTLDQQNQLFFSLIEQDERLTPIAYEPQMEGSLQMIRSVENASGLGSDKIPLQALFQKLLILHSQGPLAYVGLVWNFANRFGGGVLEPKRLSKDGKNLLEFLYALAIPVDLSHCSDQLTEDILDFTVDKLPNMFILASHSNFRKVQGVARNLLDVHAKEIFARNGVIGLNGVNYFVGESLEDMRKHIAYAQELGILDGLVLGTDFFYTDEEKFFPNFSTAKDHPKLQALIEDTLSVNQARALLAGTAQQFLTKVVTAQKSVVNTITL
ncbi:peptidase M19 [Chlamydia muridarum str. Nigg]|uniref:Peptidase M19 n=2 Tax=Chlamydia muridarum TaxID=83560 RepID=A0A069ZNJ7_CHLMR|nr:membrane dipeptidase [Chlamydia muridarum]UFT29165.1 peptidase M19 [Chlamydia trachomatis]AAF39271.1 dipeptidase, putative [Chlamydia muridarum str. Nigg]AHH22799.1 peptidase M19 [Chlamydia muridarum str. Nigg3 CMUT3-5]AHH23724.1 peptidase M19 [Chlamydia muridarum str. Nigg CM972]AID37938.1 peptidase M19 [Chlamydia muridarum str. Nigg 2 MCR]